MTIRTLLLQTWPIFPVTIFSQSSINCNPLKNENNCNLFDCKNQHKGCEKLTAETLKVTDKSSIYYYKVLRHHHVLLGEGYPHVPMVKRSQYIRIENPIHKHFAGMPMVGVKNCKNLPTVPSDFYHFQNVFFYC